MPSQSHLVASLALITALLAHCRPTEAHVITDEPFDNVPLDDKTGVTEREDALTIGRPADSQSDKLIEKFHVEYDGLLFRTVDELKTFEGDRLSRITYVRVYDPTKTGTGATAYLVAGGLNAVFVTLGFKSVRSGSIDFYVEIYGKR